MRGTSLALWGLLSLSGCPGPSTSLPKPPDFKLTPGQLDAERMLAPAITAAEEAGAERFLPVGAEALDEGEQLGSFVELGPGECLLGLTRAGDSVRDVDLFVYADDGDRLAADEAPTATAAVLVCPPRPDRVYVVARNMSGAGVVALGVMRVMPARADAVSLALEVRGRPGQDTGKLEAWPGLEKKIRQRRADLGAQWEDVRRVAVPVDPHASTTVSVRAEAGRCLDVLVVPSDEVPSVELLVMGEDGRVIARGRPPGRDRSAVVCSAIEQSVTVAIRPRSAVGLVAVVVSHSGPGAMGQLREGVSLAGTTPLLPLDGAIARHDRQWRLSTSSWGEAEELSRHEVPTRGLLRVPVALEGGCTRLDVVGGAPLAQFRAQLWRSDGVALAEAGGGESATLYACGPATKAELELEAVERPGPAAVLRRRIEDVPTALTSAPRAASRLLGRFEGLGIGRIIPSELEGLTSRRLDPGRRGEGRVTLKEDQCIDLVAAVDGPPQSVTLRLDEGADVRAEASGFGVTAVEHCSRKGGSFRYRLEVAGAEAVVLSAHRRR